MTVGSLTINLGMATADVGKGASLAKGYLEGIGAVANKLNSSLGLLGVGIGIGGLVGTLKTVSSVAGEIREQTRTAERFGMSTQELQGLQYAAKKSGVDMEVFNTSLMKMEQHLGDVANKGGDADNMFSRIGLDAKELVGAKPADAFLQIADALKDIDNVSVRMSHIREIFGRGGAPMATMFAKGSEGINKFVDDARKLHLVSDAMDLKKVGAYKAAIGGLESTFKGVSMEITTMMAPALAAIAVKISEIVQAARDFAPTIVKAVIALAAFKTAMWAIALAQKAVAATQALIVALQGPKGWLQVAAAVGIAAGVYGIVSNEIEKAGAKAEELVNANKDVAESAKALNSAMIDTADAAKRAQKVIDEGKSPWDKWADSMRDISAALAGAEGDDVARVMAAFTKAGEELDRGLGGAKSKAKELRDEIYGLRYGIDALDVKKMQELGSKPEDVAKVAALQKEAARAKELASAKDHYTQRGPIEEFNQQVGLLKDLLGPKAYKDGKITYPDARITKEQYDAGLTASLKNLEATLPQITSKPTGAYSLGSREEYSMRARINNQSPERTAKDILEQAKIQNTRLSEIQRNTAEQVVNLVVL